MNAPVGYSARVDWGTAALLLALWGAGPSSAAPPSATASPPHEGRALPDSYWLDRERGWFWYDDPRTPPTETVKPQTKPASGVARRPAELIEFETLQKRVEDLRNIAIIRPSERNLRNYLDVQAYVIEKASTFADVAQRVIWATPELDYTNSGRPVNAKALAVFDREQASARTASVARLAQTHALFFFFRSDCPYCHQFGPVLKEFEAKFGLKIVAISVDGGGLPSFPTFKVDNGIARTLAVRQVPALFLAQPKSGKIMPIGYGVLSESELLDRITVVGQPDADTVVPSTTRYVSELSVR